MAKSSLFNFTDYTIAQYLEAARTLPRFLASDEIRYEVHIAVESNQDLVDAFQDYISLFDKQEYLPDDIDTLIMGYTNDLWEFAGMDYKRYGRKYFEKISLDELIQTVIGFTLFRLSTQRWNYSTSSRKQVTDSTRQIFKNIFDIFYICHRHRINTQVSSQILIYYKENQFLSGKDRRATTNQFLYLIDRQATIHLSIDLVVSNIFKVLIKEIEIDPERIFNHCLVMDREGNIKLVKDFEKMLYRNEILTKNIVNVISIEGHKSNFGQIFFGSNEQSGIEEFCLPNLTPVTLKGNDWSERIGLKTKMYNLATEIWESYLKL